MITNFLLGCVGRHFFDFILGSSVKITFPEKRKLNGRLFPVFSNSSFISLPSPSFHFNFNFCFPQREGVTITMAYTNTKTMARRCMAKWMYVQVHLMVSGCMHKDMYVASGHVRQLLSLFIWIKARNNNNKTKNFLKSK